MPIVLVIKDMDDVHSVLLSINPIILGRSASSDVRISDEKVSGKHLALKLNSQGRVMIKDLESTNGTLLNGANITEGYLMIADKLTIGDVELSLDDSQMNPKEKRPLTREDAPTQIKYIRMPGDTAPSKKIKNKQKKDSSASQEDDAPTAVISDETSNPEKSESQEEENSKNETKNRYVKSAEKLSESHGKNEHDVDFANEKQIEMEKSTGATQMLKMSVKDQLKSNKTSSHKLRKKPDKQKKPGKKSFLEGLFKMFKGD